MLRSKEQEAGLLYEQGAKAVRAGGYELGMLAGHLIFMIKGTSEFTGPLWQARVIPPDGRRIELDRFIDYLRKPMREGLGLPSLHFLRQVLKASEQKGDQALTLVKEELAKENVDLDAVADKERDKSALKNELRPNTGRPEKGITVIPLSKGGMNRYAARLNERRPDLAKQVRAGRMKLSAALYEAGIRKKPKHICPQCGYEWRE